jgi:hypothetical protein
MNRVIFLDFDGVLHATSGSASTMRQFVWLPILMKLLRDHEDVGIVVHASARDHSSATFLRERSGIPEQRWRGVTPPNLPRWPSIQAWLSTNLDVCNYCILDDQKSEYPEPQPTNLILCNSKKGISEASVQTKIREWLRMGLNGKDEFLSCDGNTIGVKTVAACDLREGSGSQLRHPGGPI